MRTGVALVSAPINSKSTNGQLPQAATPAPGLEDNVRLDRATLAPSNAALVKRAAALCEKYRRPVATWQQARDILGLRAAGA